MSQLRDVVDDAQTTEKKMDHWTSAERETSKSRYGCEILVENGSYADVCTKEAPNDAYIVKYIVNDVTCFDLTRGTRVKIFDMYWEKFRENLKHIDFGYGRINPRLWGYQSQPPRSKKRK